MQNVEKQKMSVADLTLTGHSEAAEFALGMSSAGPLVASGGQDANVRNMTLNPKP